MSILIKNALVVSQNARRRVHYTDVFIDENVITEISDHIRIEADYKIDGNGRMLLPGLINTHSHVAMGTMKGLVDDVGMEEFLSRTAKLDAAQTDASVYSGTSLGIAEMLRTGTTSFVDLYYSEDIIANAALPEGIRAFLSWVALDKGYTTQPGDPIKNAERFIREFDSKSDLLVPGVGLQGVYACSAETMLKAKELAERFDRILPMHISESAAEVAACKKRMGRTPLAYMEKIGAISGNMLAVHEVYPTPYELRLLQRHGIAVSHNPVSNMKLGNGPAAPVPKMLATGINVTLGTDSVASNNSLDMFGTMKAAALLHKALGKDPTIVPAQDVLDMATINAAKALRMGRKLGSIEEGKLADVILINPGQSGLPMSRKNAVSNAVYSLQGLNVEKTIVNGEIVMDAEALRH